MFVRPAIVVLLFGFTLGALGQSNTLPRRLVLCLDGVSWRDVKALQEAAARDNRGRPISAFNQGYFPVSRLVSTFPSCSDVAWTELLGNEPLPGYQRSYFDASIGKLVALNGVTTTMQYEPEMHFQEENGMARAFGYALPNRGFKREMRDFLNGFWEQSAGIETYYAMLRTTDHAQHMSADITQILRRLDNYLSWLQADYRRQTGRNLEILILSDHGNNHAGPGKRFPVARFLKSKGYRISNSIQDPRDVIVPTAGIQSWVGIHNTPSETPRLASLLVHLEGVDLVMSQDQENQNSFFVCNRNNERALITRDPVRNFYRYTLLSGDPLEYAPVLDALKKQDALDKEGFASAADWVSATMQHRYPVALERITRGFTSVARNPANILLSLDNRYVHAGFWVFHASRLVTCAGTHGGLDDLNSNGILLSNFVQTKDTVSSQLAPQFAYFAGRNRIQSPEKAFIPESIPPAEKVLSGNTTQKAAHKPFLDQMERDALLPQSTPSTSSSLRLRSTPQ